MGINSYNKTGKTAKWPLELFDPSPYLKRETNTVPDERHGQAIVINAILLELEAIEKVLGTLPGWQEGETFLDLTLGNMIYGDGSTGDVTVSTGITLTADVYYNDLTVTSAGSIKTDGYRIFVRGQMTIDSSGVIERDGNAGVVSTGGAALTTRVVGGGTAGGDDDTNGTNATSALGGAGGDGGGGATGGTVTVPAVNPGKKDIAVATRMTWRNDRFTGGAGGGGGSSANGGGGGGGAGLILIAARRITNNGTISAIGGAGDDGQSGDAGGGGGGGGGFISILSSQAIDGNAPDVSGGLGGSLSGSGANGSAGSDGASQVVIL